ncbi:hypothetical protein ACWD1Z_35630 [Streptomyces sp. NPDC002784]
MTIDDNGRPSAIKTTAATTALIDLAYSYASAGKDTTKIRTRTDNLTKYKSPCGFLRCCGRAALLLG